MESYPFGGNAIDSVGEPLPAATLKACQEADAILMGKFCTIFLSVVRLRHVGSYQVPLVDQSGVSTVQSDLNKVSSPSEKHLDCTLISDRQISPPTPSSPRHL